MTVLGSGNPWNTRAQAPVSILVELGKLHQTGVLSDEEFAAARQKLLAG